MNIGYHTRSFGDNKVKLAGGSFGGSLDMETANRLVSSHFTVTVKPSGTPVFVDREGREVCLYMTVDARETEVGKKALKEWRVAKTKEEEARQAQAEWEAAEVEELMAGLTHEEIVARLRNPR